MSKLAFRSLALITHTPSVDIEIVECLSAMGTVRHTGKRVGTVREYRLRYSGVLTKRQIQFRILRLE